MVDIKYIRENKKEFEKGIRVKGFDIDIDLILKSGEESGVLRKKIEKLNTERKGAAETRDVEKGRKVKSELDKLEAEEKLVAEKVDDLLRKLPNLPLSEVPIGKDETKNVVIKEVGNKPKFDFPAKDYIALGEKLGLMKKSGTSYEYDGIKLGRGYDATRQFLRENKKVSGEILRAILKQLKEGGTLAAAPSVDEAAEAE